ncbi:hypothetical protein E8E11_004060 [Didymella keratinophila]|nr:hypothetical protein E8E11_004060 [Didymella keratinophila]
MPPQKPSPHRFIAPVPAAQTPKPKPTSHLRHAISAQIPGLQFKKITPAKRFVVAPTEQQYADEGNGATVPTGQVADRVESPTSSLPEFDVMPRPRARKLDRVESIEEAASSPSRPTYEHVDEDESDVMQTIEHGAMFAKEDAHDDPDDDEDDLLFKTTHTSKRRRTSPPSPIQHHAAPQTPMGATSHRFRIPRTPGANLNAAGLNASGSNATTPASASASTTTTSRPHFLLPAPRSPSKPSAPLPEIFSPSRKAQKYTPNGLASSVQAWIIEAAQQGPAAGIVWGREREDGVRVKIKVLDLGGREGVECWPGGTTFVSGETEPGMYNASRAGGVAEGQGLRVLLAGHGGARNSAGVRLRVGSIVGIRAPTWELEVGREKWTVGVDWLVLY